MPGSYTGPRTTARTAFGSGQTWEDAVTAALAELGQSSCDVLFIAASSSFQPAMDQIGDRLWRELGAPILFGASSPAILIDELEPDGPDGIALMALTLPGATIASARISSSHLEHTQDGTTLRQRLNVIAEDINVWIVLASPFGFEVGTLVDLLADGFPHAHILGGMVAPDRISRSARLLLNTETFDDGAILLGIGGPYALFPIMSHGTDPIGQPWTVTATNGEWIESIGGQKPTDLIDETLLRVPPDLRNRARANLLVGFAIDEYRHDFVRSDFVVRSITGVDAQSGAIAVGYHARPGQTVHFQLRDPATADLDLTLCLDGARLELTGRRPIAALAFPDESRGEAFFGRSHHDSALIRKKFPAIPVVGLSSAAEIGPSVDQTIINTGGLAMGILFHTL